jgi:hypothetical protein
MKKFLMSLALSVLFVLGVNAQEKGAWYLGAGDIANQAWTEWSIAPSIGYGVTNDLMVGVNISQADSTVDRQYDLHARYFFGDYFAYIATTGLDTENMKYGVGRMFTFHGAFHRGLFIDPKLVYDAKMKTTNLMLGIGLKF